MRRQNANVQFACVHEQETDGGSIATADTANRGKVADRSISGRFVHRKRKGLIIDKPLLAPREEYTES
jgi:hypothetical protein